MSAPRYKIEITPGGIRFSIGTQMFTLARTEEDDDPECEENRKFMAKMLDKALWRLQCGE